MRAFLSINLLLLLTTTASGQTFAEWFRQNATQRKYLIEQIAALRVYGTYLKKGYDIARDGLQTVNRFKRGELDLHNAFFEQLGLVNTKVRNDPRAREIVAIAGSISTVSQNFRKALAKDGALQGSESAYLRGVVDRVLQDSHSLLSELEDLLTDRSVDLTDDGRLDRMEKLYSRMEANLSFCQAFCNGAILLMADRTQEAIELKTSRGLHGIN